MGLEDFPRSRKRIHYNGSIAKLNIGIGKREDALALYQKNLNFSRREERKEKARTLGDMGNLLRIMGRLDEAERQLKEALALNTEFYDQNNSPKPYIKWHLAKVFAKQKRWAPDDQPFNYFKRWV